MVVRYRAVSLLGAGFLHASLTERSGVDMKLPAFTPTPRKGVWGPSAGGFMLTNLPSDFKEP